jgi:hypothetical protein
MSQSKLIHRKLIDDKVRGGYSERNWPIERNREYWDKPGMPHRRCILLPVDEQGEYSRCEPGFVVKESHVEDDVRKGVLLVVDKAELVDVSLCS